MTPEQRDCEHLQGYRTEQGVRVCQTCAIPWNDIPMWRCKSCHVLNRHDRTRCTNCDRRPPQ